MEVSKEMVNTSDKTKLKDIITSVHCLCSVRRTNFQFKLENTCT